MVKPPKTMEPEAINLKKAGRDKTKAFTEDSFRNYMGRKIHLQRQQFGLLLPPPPEEEAERRKVRFSAESVNGESVSGSSSTSPTLSSGKRRRLSFDPLSACQQHNVSAADKAKTGSSASKKKTKKRPKFGIHKVVKRLKMKHGESPSHLLPPFVGPHERKEQTQQSPPEPSLSQRRNSDSLKKPSADSPHQHPSTTTASQEQQHTPRLSSSSKQPHINVSKPRSLVKKRKDLFFQGVTVIVNGYTNPDTDTLQRLLHRHGGDLEKYETSRVTHIIAESLSTAKANLYKKQKKPRPVCKPTWITDSVQAQKLLPASLYLIDEVKGVGNNGIQSVASFFSGGGHKTPERDNSTLDERQRGSHGDDEVIECDRSMEACQTTTILPCHHPQTQQLVDKPNADLEKTHMQKDHASPPGGNNAQSTRDERQQEGAPTDDVIQCERRIEECPEELPRIEHQTPLESPNAGNPTTQHVPEDLTEKPACFTSPSKAGAQEEDTRYIDGRVRTVGTDPKFLESFFAASRLSFIGSYKQRAKQSPTKQQPSSSSGPRAKRFVFHVDLDSFFASVVLRHYPHYVGKPVAISHQGENRKGEQNSKIPTNSSSECATCNYEARKFGIKKGMFLGQAKALCPDLIVLQYDFQGYEEVSEAVSGILDTYAEKYDGFVEHVSCDEAYIEFHIGPDNNQRSEDKVAGEVAESIRNEIFEVTQCTASVGVATNKFIAKLATDRAKPNGSFVASDPKALLKPLLLKQLHGIGHRLNERLVESGLVSVQDIWDMGSRGESELCRLLGPGVGKKIHGFCNGVDNRKVQPAERKTIGAECNYGVRFDGPYGVDHMIEGLCKEVETRMTNVGVQGVRITLKMKQRKPGARPPPKFLGHGSCHNLSKSGDLGHSKTRSWKVMKASAWALFQSMKVSTDDVRGMGIVVSKLTPDDGANNGVAETTKKQNSISSLFAAHTKSSTNKKAAEPDDVVECPPTPDHSSRAPVVVSEVEMVSQHQSEDPADSDSEVEILSQQQHGDEWNHFSDIALPPLSQVHMSQVKALPSPLRKEIMSRMERSKVPKVEKRPQQNSGRFRQTNMIRMLKLAAVKSNPGEVSLTQLESLPLEMQLQVVNNDHQRVGRLSPRHRSRIQPIAAAAKSSPKRSASTTARSSKVNDKKPSTQDILKPLELIPESHPSDFYETNIRPLNEFMDENDPGGDDAKGRVLAFLDVCLSEDRLPDVIVLLRAIRNRNDSWGNEFDCIVDTVDERVKRIYPFCGLDREWI